jgi:EpsD family peptidyl-prolyl cis-trans isomerase
MFSTNESMTTLADKNNAVESAMLLATALFCAALLSSCGGKDEKTHSQVAAKVNDVEITIHQINSRLTRSGVTGETAAKEASKKILDSLIDQELLVQQARRKKLDRDPEVMQAIEDAKVQILSQAYLERMVYSRTPPTPAETKAFYDSHPELFAKRKAYKFHAYAAIPKDKFNDGLKSALDSAKTPNEVVSILKSRAIEFKESEVQWLAEQVPMEMLPSIAKMKVGDIASLEQGTQVTIMLLDSAVESPVDENQAKPIIEKFIANSKNKELVDNKLKQLHAGEQITYIGEFAETPPSSTAIAPDAPEKKESPAPQPPQSDDFIKKGLKGLK